MSGVIDFNQIKNSGLAEAVRKQSEQLNNKSNNFDLLQKEAHSLLEKGVDFKEVVETLVQKNPGVSKEIIETKASYAYGDIHNYFPKLGPNKESNVVKVWLLVPKEHIIDEFKKDAKFNMFYSPKLVHKFIEGNNKANMICRKTLRIYDKKNYEKCPICDKFPWADKDIKPEVYAAYSKNRPKRNGWVNVYIEEDLLYPENNGTVKRLYLNGVLIDILEKEFEGEKDKYGNKIEGEEGNADIWYPTTGCYFKIIIKNGIYTDYKSSKFAYGKPLFNGDNEKLTEIIKQTHFLDYPVESVLSYNDLKEKYESFYAKVDGLVLDNNDDEDNTNNFNEELRKKVEEEKINNEDPTDDLPGTESEDIDIVSLIQSTFED